MSLEACIRRCPVTTRSPWFSNSLGLEELLEHRGLRLLQLQEQRILAVAADQQGDPGARADAADADHLAREVDQLELLEQHAPVVLERVAVGAQGLVQRVEHFVAFHALREFVDRDDQRRFGHDPRLPVDLAA